MGLFSIKTFRAASFAAAVLVFAALAPRAAVAQPQPDNGEPEKVFVESADYMKHEKETRVTVLRGMVKIRIKDSLLQADEVTLNENDNTVAAWGRVVLTDGNNVINGSALFYDYEKEYFEMSEPEGTTTAKDVNGYVYYHGMRALGTRKKIKIYKGWFTTCEPTCPTECHVQADQITIQPDVKIVSKHSYFYIGPRKFWYLPIHVISLKKSRDRYMPEFGYNEIEGFFVKNKYPYMSKDNIAGIALFDYMTKKGVRYGGIHDYISRRFGGRGHNYFLTNNEKDTGNVSMQVNQWQEFVAKGGIKGRVNYNRTSFYSAYSSFGRSSHSDIDLSMSRQVMRKYAPAAAGQQQKPDMNKRSETFTYRTSQDHTYSSSSNSAMTLQQNFTFSQDFTYQHSLNTTNRKSALQNEDKEGSFTTSFTKRSRKFTITGNTSKTFDLDGDSYALDNTYGVNTVLPEVSLDFAPDTLNWMIPVKNPQNRPNISLNVRHSRRREGSRNNSRVSRFTTITNSLSRTMTFSKSMTFTPSQTYTQNMYHTKDANFTIGHAAVLAWRLTQVSSLNFNYNRSQGKGGSPFGGNRQSETNSLTGSYSIGKPRTNVNLTSGYDYQNHFYSPLSLSYTHGTSKNSQLNLRTGFDLENDIWQTTATDMTFTRKNMDLRVGANWDTKELEMLNANMTAGIRRNNGWRFTVNGVYSDPRNAPFLRTWTATKTRCCSEVQFSYNSDLDEYRLNYYMLAMPKERLGFSSTRQGITVEETSINKEMGTFIQ